MRRRSSTSSAPKLEDKAWDRTKESEIFERWDKENIYKFSSDSGRRIFTIDTPPPYPSGRPWHAGAAAHYSQIDMIARTGRMTGHEVFFPIGIDRNGLPVEIYTQKKFKIDIRRTSREKFLELCRHALDDLEAEFLGIMKSMGLSGDFKNYYRTDSEEYRTLTQTTFIQLWRRGLIYQATRPNTYCTSCGTTIADAEVEYEDRATKLWYIKFKLVGEDDYLTIATTRPELLYSCRITIVHPDDERYKAIHGRKVLVPLFDREVEIKPHPAAKREFGSGAVMICSYGDYTDVALFRELGLQEIISIDESGRTSSSLGKYGGLPIDTARKKITEDLESTNLIVKVEDIKHRTPICERSKTPIEIIPMNEFYLKQLEFIPQLRSIAEGLTFYPAAHKQILLDWIDSVRIDWPISRRRYYGTEIPVWHCKKCHESFVPDPGRYYQPWRERPPVEKCSKCESTEFQGDERTFDTWMDSSGSPLFITKYLRDNGFFGKTFPPTIRPQAKDIVRTWLYYTILKCFHITGKPVFEKIWIMGYGVDEKGERMSKSKGNVLDPIPILKRYGADTFRFWSASETNLGSDFRCSEARIAGAGKFLTKLWNISRFISSFEEPKEVRLTPSDEWILAELSKLIKECQEGYNQFNFFVPATKVREFTWNLFAAHYVELAKARTYGVGFTKDSIDAAKYALHRCLRAILLLLSPITPFITDHIWSTVYGGTSIHLETFPHPEWVEAPSKITPSLLDFNSKVWNLKKEKGLSLKDKISIEIPDSLQSFDADLKAMHNIS